MIAFVVLLICVVSIYSCLLRFRAIELPEAAAVTVTLAGLLLIHEIVLLSWIGLVMAL